MDVLESKEEKAGNFIFEAIKKDISEGGRFEGKTVHTRFPPEPNGYLHIGHAKAICINFSAASLFKGICNLRMDDTNPSKEETKYVQSIKEDVKWLGFDWENRFYYASDYFDKMFENACKLIEKGLAYVCELSAEEVKKNRGDANTPAVSPFRERPIQESRELFLKMKDGKFPDGSMTLRAKIDLNSGNFNMRDPVIYRISRANHHQSGSKWCIYPMYDYAHPIEDALEGITHSLCSLEFEDHRPLYEWVVSNMEIDSKPRQIEFARLNINNTIMSKRKLRKLVEEGYVESWDDPRLPTISGLRRRGYTPASIRNFCEKIGVSKVTSTVEYSFLEHCLREDLNLKAKRIMVALNPIKLIITNYPEEKEEFFEVENNPNDENSGKRKVRFSREVYIDAEDFMANPVKKYFRLFPGGEVRLKSAYVIKCTGFKEDENGNILEVYAQYDLNSRGGNPSDGRKIKGTIQWVDVKSAVDITANMYENLFTCANPEESENFLDSLNQESLKVVKGCKAESNIKEAKEGDSYQFMRIGYFSLDSKKSTSADLVFNRSVGLKDSFKKINK